MISLWLNIANAGLKDFLIKWEGKHNEIYYLDGKPHIGIGHLISNLSCVKINGECNDPRLGFTDEQINLLFLQDVKVAQRKIRQFVQVPLTNGQQKALISYVFNVGYQAFVLPNGEPTKLVTYLNEGNYLLAGEEIDIIKSNGEVSNGLIQRRFAEQLMWD